VTRAIALLLAAVTAFWAKALFGRVTIQWDAAGYYFPYQRHFADSLHAGTLPFWTSTLFSGFPFLADLQTGAWYPPNWPFFLAGVRPGTMFWENWVHACLAAAGAFLLAQHLTRNRAAAVLAGLVFSLSGYFTAHGSHIGLFQAAAYLPLVLYLFERRAVAGLALAGGAMSLAGHFQTALYVFTAMALWAAATPKAWKRGFAMLAAAAAGSLAIAAVQVLPSAELLRHSVRAQLAAGDWTQGTLGWRGAATFVYPNAAGAFNEPYTGPGDITQHYFYAGVLLLPLAGLGLADRRVRPCALLLVAPATLYAIRPGVIAELPGFSSVRAPSHAMLVATLGLALAAGAGAARLRWKQAAPALCVLFAADLWWWNMQRTRLLYANGTYAEVHEPGVRWFRELVKAPLPPMQRLAAPGRWAYFLPADAPFGLGVETTYGSNALLMSHYYDYMAALNQNESLLSALGVSVKFDRKEWVAHKHEPALPRFYFPPRLLYTPDPKTAIKTVNAVTTGVLEGAPRDAENCPGEARVLEYSESRYRARVSAAGPAVMRIAIPWYPGWKAVLDGREIPVRRMDHALMAVEVPAGTHEVMFEYHSRWFAAGAGVSLLALACCLAGLKPRAGKSTFSLTG
jgi:hypothetical protein